VRSSEVVVPGLSGPGLLRSPGSADPQVRGGVVALHGAALPQRDQPLFEHLARTLATTGYAVLSFDRRASTAGEDTSLELQAEDALLACAWLRTSLDAVVGVYGFSQGAWAAALAASHDPAVAFLVLVGCSGVSPAEQMRFYTDELLRRAGYGATDRGQLLEARLVLEEVLRGEGDFDSANKVLKAASTRPWFEHAYLPTEVVSGERWPDMDYDPEPTFSKIHCPTLLIYGDDEECVPAETSKQVWARAAQTAGGTDLTVIDLPGCGHFPAPGADAASPDAPTTGFSPAYTSALETWVGRL
jgi:uncharacterized protein